MYGFAEFSVSLNGNGENEKPGLFGFGFIQDDIELSL